MKPSTLTAGTSALHGLTFWETKYPLIFVTDYDILKTNRRTPVIIAGKTVTKIEKIDSEILGQKEQMDTKQRGVIYIFEYRNTDKKDTPSVSRFKEIPAKLLDNEKAMRVIIDNFYHKI